MAPRTSTLCCYRSDQPRWDRGRPALGPCRRSRPSRSGVRHGPGVAVDSSGFQQVSTPPCAVCTGAMCTGRVHRLDRWPGSSLRFISLRVKQLRLEWSNGKANVPAAQPETEEQARVPRAHEHTGRADDSEPAAEEGSQTARRPGRREVAASWTRAVSAAPASACRERGGSRVVRRSVASFSGGRGAGRPTWTSWTPLPPAHVRASAWSCRVMAGAPWSATG